MVKAAQGLRQPKSDLFHDNVPHKFILRVWRVMQDTPRHTYQILTKRPERMAEILSGREFHVLSNPSRSFSDITINVACGWVDQNEADKLTILIPNTRGSRAITNIGCW